MGLETPFLTENTPDGLANFGFYKIQSHTKSVIVGMLKTFFHSINNTYKLQLPDIVGVQGEYDIAGVQSPDPDTITVHIERDFPYTERKLPLILVSIKSAREKKMYVGSDNFAYWDEMITSTGNKVATRVYHGASEVTVGLIILTQSHEERMKYADLINMCFTHYFRWQYFYTLGDGDQFSISPNMSQLDFGAETEVTDESMTAIVYITDVTMETFIEYTFSRVTYATL